jgi:hypothetical protein
MNQLQRFVKDLIADRFHTASALAEAIGMSVSALLRGVESGSLGVDKLLKLADLAGANPSDVLTLAGKAETAALIERLYKVDGRHVLTSVDRELVALPTAVKRRAAALVRVARTTP